MNLTYLILAGVTIVVYGHMLFKGFSSSAKRSVMQDVLFGVIALTWAGAVYIGFHSVWPCPLCHAIGIAVNILALGLFFYAHRQHRALKPCKVFSLEPPPQRAFVTSGPYRSIRHPIYTAYLVSLAAFGIYSGHWFLLIALALWTWLYTLAAKREESHFLQSEYGEEYSRYMLATGRFVPSLLPRKI